MILKWLGIKILRLSVVSCVVTLYFDCCKRGYPFPRPIGIFYNLWWLYVLHKRLWLGHPTGVLLSSRYDESKCLHVYICVLLQIVSGLTVQWLKNHLGIRHVQTLIIKKSLIRFTHCFRKYQSTDHTDREYNSHCSLQCCDRQLSPYKAAFNYFARCLCICIWQLRW